MRPLSGHAVLGPRGQPAAESASTDTAVLIARHAQTLRAAFPTITKYFVCSSPVCGATERGPEPRASRGPCSAGATPTQESGRGTHPEQVRPLHKEGTGRSGDPEICVHQS